MTSDISVPATPADSVAYAETLYGYAARRLDPFSLRCWIIQRLMLDEGLEHGCAEDVFEDVRAKDREARAREARHVTAPRRRALLATRTPWSKSHRLVHPRPAA
jgi:hypothetical protein